MARLRWLAVLAVVAFAVMWLGVMLGWRQSTVVACGFTSMGLLLAEIVRG